MMAVSSDFLIVEPPAAGMQRLRSRFSGHAYDRHRHETYAVGVTEAGLQCFHYRGAARASTAGRVVALHPDEAHDGHSGAPGGFAYRMLYADPLLIPAALGGRPVGRASVRMEAPIAGKGVQAFVETHLASGRVMVIDQRPGIVEQHLPGHPGKVPECASRPSNQAVCRSCRKAWTN